jgi:hypothetical protein
MVFTFFPIPYHRVYATSCFFWPHIGHLGLTLYSSLATLRIQSQNEFCLIYMSRKWIPKTFEQACKRAAGRRRYHAKRRRARDKRQLLIMSIFVDLNWRPHYGIGRTLAEALSVDPATISRDIRYILKFRASLIKDYKVSEKFADAVIQRLVAAGIHPRAGYSWTYTYTHGVSSLRVRRGYAYALGVRRPPRQKN